MSSLEFSSPEQAEVFVDFFENAPDLFYIFEKEGKILHANKAFREQLYYSGSEIRKLNICDLVHIDDRTRRPDQSNCSADFKNGFRLKCKDGKYKWFSRNTTYRDSRNLYYIVARNITEEKIKQQAYLKNYYDFTFFLDNSPDPIARFDRQLKHIYVNPATEKFTGLKAAQLLGKTHYELAIPAELAETFKSSILMTFDTGSQQVRKISFPTFSGMKHIEATLMPEFDRSEDPATVLVVCKDITEKEKLVGKYTSQVNRLKIIADIGEMVLQEVSIKRLLEQTSKSLSGTLQAKLCTIAKFNRSESTIVSIAPYPKDYNSNQQFQVKADGLAHFIMNSEEPVIVKDFQQDQRFRPSPGLLSLNVKSGVFVKINVHGNTFGFLGVYTHDYRDFTTDTVLFLRNICNMIATAIEKHENSEFIKASEKSYRRIFNNSTDLIIVIDQSCTAIDINKSALKFFGLKKDTFPQKAPMALTDPSKQDPDEMLQICTKAFYEKAQKTGWWVKNKYGRSSYLDVSVRRGNYYGKDVLILTARDRTEAMLAEREIRNREEKYRTLLETVNDGVVYVDQNLNLLFANKKFSEMVNIPLKELVSRNISDIIEADHLNQLFLEKYENLRAGQFQEFEVKVTIKGEEKWFLINFAPITDAGTVQGALATLKETTKRKQAELRLEEKNQDLNTFIYKVSHDLKGPLASVLGLINVARLEVTEAPALKYLNLIDKSTRKLDKTLHDLVELTQIQHGQLQISQFSLKKLAEEVVESLENLENFNKINLNLDIPSNLRVNSDHLVLRSILQNLIINAYKYHNLSQNDPFVLVSARKHQNQVTLVIEDNGVGIHASLHKKIFDMFFRGQESAKGTGLGLFIVKNAVIKLNGTISLKSERTLGSKFTVHIPV